MSDYIIRDWQPGDRAALKELWKLSFGDDDEVIEDFFDRFLRPGCCLTASAEGKLVSAMYILPDHALRPFRQNVLTMGYTYALATLPAYRGRGIGSAVYRACCDRILETADAACVIPAEADLFPLYETAGGAQPLAVLREARLTREELRAFAPVQAARVPVSMYIWMRENLLSGLPHACLDDRVYDHAEACGMEFFTIGGRAACAAETGDGVCHIRELIDPGDDPMISAATLARWCPAEEYIVRSPAFFRGPGEIRPYALGVLKVPPDYPMPADLWWGLGLE